MQVARKAYQLLDAVFSASHKPSQQSAARLYTQQAIQASQCALTDQSFSTALTALGVRLAEGATRKRGSSKVGGSPSSAEKAASKPSQTTPGWKETDGSPNLNGLQLLLRLLKTVSQLQVCFGPITQSMQTGC